MLFVHPPNDGRSVNKRVNLEMDAQSQDEGSKSDPPPLNSPQKSHRQNTQQALRAATRRNRRNHGIP